MLRRHSVLTSVKNISLKEHVIICESLIVLNGREQKLTSCFVFAFRFGEKVFGCEVV